MLLALCGCGDALREDEAASSASGASASNGSTSAGPNPTTAGQGPGSAESTVGGESSSSEGGFLFDLGGPDGGSGGGLPVSCDDEAGAESTVGCVFYAVDLDQAVFFEEEQFAVVVSNVQAAGQAEVVVEERQGNAWVVVDGPAQVAPLSLHTFALPNKVQQGSGIAVGGAYRITSTVPIIAYQFNPLQMGFWSSDASLLYPARALDTLADVVQWGPGSGYGYITVVASRDGTQVTVQPTTNTASGGGVPPGIAGGTFSLQLDEGDAATIRVAEENASLSGSRVESNEPIAVFSAHECAFIPEGVYACDHIEEQLAGLRLWGKEFAASRMPVRAPATPEASTWQIYASEDDTVLEFEAMPGVTGLPASPTTLQRGELLEFDTAGTSAAPGDFVVTATKPVAMFNFMTGWESVGIEVGDPAMLQLSPVQQYLNRYVVLVPSQWENDFLVVTRHAGETVELDNMAVEDNRFLDIGGGYEVARLRVGDGVHQLWGASPFSVSVVGYDQADSYAYLGGMGTGLINPEPAG